MSMKGTFDMIRVTILTLALLSLQGCALYAQALLGTQADEWQLRNAQDELDNLKYKHGRK